MGDKGLVIDENAELLPITDGLKEFEIRNYKQAKTAIGGGKIEIGAIFDSDGNPIVGFKGKNDHVSFPSRYLEVENGTFTHFHPDKYFGGTLSMTDLKTFAKSKWGELRATSAQGQVYSIKAGPNADKAALLRWTNKTQKLLNKNFSNSYHAKLKEATTVLKSGKNKGKVKLTQRTTKGTKITYVNPMTPAQAARYARQYSVGLYERTYQKELKKLGFTYSRSKAKGA